MTRNTALLDTTKRLMGERSISLKALADEAEVDYEWLSKFSQGRINDPGVRKVQAVHDALVAVSSNAAA